MFFIIKIFKVGIVIIIVNEIELEGVIQWLYFIFVFVIYGVEVGVMFWLSLQIFERFMFFFFLEINFEI